MSGSQTMLYSNYRLLIVEDEEINRFVLEKILRAVNWNFTFAGSGEEALVLIQNSVFDFVLLDIELPGLNGYETAKAIKNLPWQDSTPPHILAMTGHQYADHAINTADCGINGWIVKPFDLEQLLTAILNTIEQAANTNLKSVINLNLLTEIAGDDPEFIRICIELFLREMPENLSRLKSAIINTEWETIRTTSHKMKTSLNYMGMNEYRLAAANIEKLSRDKRDMECIRSSAQLITTGCRQAFKELNEFMFKSEEPKS